MNFIDHYIINEMSKGIIDRKEYIPGSKYPMEKQFAYWNRKLFDGKLPTPKFNKKRSSVSGSMASLIDRRTRTLVDVDNWLLTINPKGKRTEEAWDGILIHEMIHLFFQFQFLNKPQMDYKKLLGRDGHAEPFTKKVDELSRKVSFTIPITDEMLGMDKETPLKKEVFFMTFEHKPGEYAALLLKPTAIEDPKIKDMIAQMGAQYESRGQKFASGFTNNSQLNGITVKTKWPRGGRVSWALIPKEVGEELIKMGINV